jgi:predicted transposase YbfD/YdcC
LAIEGAVVTIDAAGCQRKIAQTILDKKADYLLALKGNQGTLREDVELFAREQKEVAFKDASVSQDTTVDGDRGRIETRTVTVLHDIAWLQKNHQWPGLKSVVWRGGVSPPRSPRTGRSQFIRLPASSRVAWRTCQCAKSAGLARRCRRNTHARLSACAGSGLYVRRAHFLTGKFHSPGGGGTRVRPLPVGVLTVGPSVDDGVSIAHMISFKESKN